MYIEKLSVLMEKAPGSADEIVEYAQALTKYVNTVADQELAIERNRAFLISERIDRSEYIARIEKTNDERNKVHDKACAACKNINDIARRNGQQKIFDFEPQMTQEHGLLKFSQDNHYRVAKFCADLTNELFEKGTLEKSEHLLDQVVEKAKEKAYPELNKSEMTEKFNEYTSEDISEDLQSFMNERKTGIVTFRDGCQISLKNPTKYGEYDIETFGNISLGGASCYFDKGDNRYIGREIFKNIVMEISGDHGGTVRIEEKEQERSSLLQDVLNGNYGHSNSCLEQDIER